MPTATSTPMTQGIMAVTVERQNSAVASRGETRSHTTTPVRHRTCEATAPEIAAHVR
ncbi:MAG: hypothetical protein R5N68_01935 [Cutibacterium granulosum]|nr:hypothetical protein [Cutibacterium granulosum]